MKLIGSLFGLAAVRVSGDTVVPLKGAVIKDMIDGIGRQYEFAVKPPAQLAAQGQPMLFQGGALKTGEQRIGIVQLGLVPNGDFAMAQTTDQADAILSDLINFLERTFEYRYSSAELKRLYHSSIVVEFEKDIEAFKLFAQIEKLLNRGKEGTPPRFQFKRLGFGQGDSIPTNVNIESLEAADFTIERRAGEPYSSNRFFCGATMQTSEHFKVLEEIEKFL